MDPLYRRDLAYIHAAAFGALARGAAPELLRRLAAAAIPIRRVVDAGCGAGPLSAILAQSAFEVTGIDASAELLEIARAAAPGAHFLHASLYESALPPCEGIIALGEPLTYHSEIERADERVAAFFARASQALAPGGLLIFDVIETGEPSLTARTWAAGDDWAVLVDTREDAPARTLVRNIETFRRDGDLYRRGRELHQVRLFDTPELCRLLESLHFRVETANAYGSHPLAPRRRAFFCEFHL